jgi:hypothetical protein
LSPPPNSALEPPPPPKCTCGVPILSTVPTITRGQGHPQQAQAVHVWKHHGPLEAAQCPHELSVTCWCLGPTPIHLCPSLSPRAMSLAHLEGPHTLQPHLSLASHGPLAGLCCGFCSRPNYVFQPQLILAQEPSTLTSHPFLPLTVLLNHSLNPSLQAPQANTLDVTWPTPTILWAHKAHSPS